MEKKYRLLKDLPGVKAGTIFDRVKGVDLPSHSQDFVVYSPKSFLVPQFASEDIKNNPEWFEEIDEEKLFTRKDLLLCIDHTLDLIKSCGGDYSGYMNHGSWPGTHRIVKNWEPENK